MLYSLKWLHAAAVAAERLIKTRVEQDPNYYDRHEHMLKGLALMKFRANIHVFELSYPRTIFFFGTQDLFGFYVNLYFCSKHHGWTE